MVGGGQGCWVKGGGAIIFFFSRGGRGGAEHYYFVCIPIHSYVFGKKIEAQFTSSYVFPPKRSLNPNSFVCLQIHSYIFQKKTLHLNSFVCIPIHSYVFQFIRMSSRRGWWVEKRLYLFIFSRGGGGARNIIILCVFQFVFFVCLPIHSYVFQFIGGG